MAKDAKINKLQLYIDQVSRTHSVLNRNQIQKIFNSTPKKYQYSRPGKGGGNWTYVKSSYVRKVLDSVFGFSWDFDIETTLSEAFEIAKVTKTCVVKGKLTVNVKVDGQWQKISKTQFGRAEVKMKRDSDIPLDFGNDMKAATSDCLKKCASLFGIAADIYEADEFMEIEIIGSDESSERLKQTKKKVEEMKLQATEVEYERTNEN